MCLCSSTAITRPRAPEVEKPMEYWVERGEKGWTEAKGGAGGLTTTEIRKDDFQSGNSKVMAAWGIWMKKIVSFL